MIRREKLVEALVADLWGRTSEGIDQVPEYVHYCENDLEGPPRLLDRLG